MLKKIRRSKVEERRNRQVTTVFRPSVYIAAQKIAYIHKCSPNNIINIALEEYIAQHQNDVVEYDRLEAESKEDN